MSRMNYVGMDVHFKTIVAAWQRPNEKIRIIVVSNTPEGIERLVKAIGTDSVWGCYEASSCG